jgi:serine/threonine protein kinase
MDNLQPTDPDHLGGYQLVGRLGTGGMGIVYCGKDRGGKLVAIKVIRSTMVNDGTFRQRFKREIELARKVKSPYVAQIMDSCTESGKDWWYVSEYIPGLTIAQAMHANGGRLPIETSRRVAHDLACGLQAVHAAGIVHRDLKPENVIISPQGVKIVDFGIADAVEGSMTNLTSTGEVIGTPSYMCPQRLRKEQIEARSDIFSFGGLMVYATTGHAPFGKPGMSPHLMVTAIINNELNLNGLPEEFRTLVTRCLKHDPNERPHAHEIHGLMTVKANSGDMTGVIPTRVMTAMQDVNEQSRVMAAQFAALKPIPLPRRTGESNADWMRRNKPYIDEMAIWRRGERKRKRTARRTERRRHRAAKRQLRRVPLTIKVLTFVSVLVALFYFGPTYLPQLPDQIKEGTDQLKTKLFPDSQTNNEPIVALPEAPFAIPTQPEAASDPDRKGSSIKITGFTHKQRQLTLSVTITGYTDHGDTAFSESCVKVRDGHSVTTVHPTSYHISGHDDNSQTGTIVYSTAFQGNYLLYPECNQDRSIKPAFLGTAKNVNIGVLHYGTTVVPVLYSHTANANLTVGVIPRETEGSQMCLYSRGQYFRPTKVRKVTLTDVIVSELTFVSKKQGKLYISCSEKNGNVKPHGRGVNVG